MALNINRKLGAPQVTFNPDSYKRVYRQMQNGIWREIIEMMNMSETDSQVYGCLLGRNAGLQTQFAVQPFEDATESDIERAQLIESVIGISTINNCSKTSWKPALKNSAS